MIAVQVTDGSGEIFIGTRDGMAIRFPEADVRPMGRTAYGVARHHAAGRRLRGGDGGRAARRDAADRHRARLRQADRDRRVPRAVARRRRRHQHRDLRSQRRRSSASPTSQEGDELLIITQQGMIIRMPTNDVRAIGRATQGVRLIDIEGDDKVVPVARLVEKEEEPPGRVTRSAVVAPLLTAMIAAVMCAMVEQSLLERFFQASRLRDRTRRVQRIATVIFEPLEARHRHRLHDHVRRLTSRLSRLTYSARQVTVTAPVRLAERSDAPPGRSCSCWSAA